MLTLRSFFVFPQVNLINQNSGLKIVTVYGHSLLKQTYVNRLMEDILLCLYDYKRSHIEVDKSLYFIFLLVQNVYTWHDDGLLSLKHAASYYIINIKLC
jgi:hypothetical protein